jgi:hypothetical protein
MQYNVFTVEFLGQPNKPNHVAIYVETKPKSGDHEGSGIKYHVVGTILLGMNYARETSGNYMLSIHNTWFLLQIMKPFHHTSRQRHL